MQALLASHNTPFSVALALLLLLLVVQVSGIGHLLGDGHGDADLSADGDLDVGASLASLVGIGKLPFMAWLSIFLAVFGLVGLSLQELLDSLLGAPLPPLPATAAGLVAALPVTGLVVLPIARIWPHDETTAVSTNSLLGRRGCVTIGRSYRGCPARVAVRDVYGQTHHVMVEPHEDDTVFEQDDEVLLVRREGELFFAVGGQQPFRLTG